MNKIKELLAKLKQKVLDLVKKVECYFYPLQEVHNTGFFKMPESVSHVIVTVGGGAGGGGEPGHLTSAVVPSKSLFGESPELVNPPQRKKAKRKSKKKAPKKSKKKK